VWASRRERSERSKPSRTRAPDSRRRHPVVEQLALARVVQRVPRRDVADVAQAEVLPARVGEHADLLLADPDHRLAHRSCGGGGEQQHQQREQRRP
jgi:hypothetical protein